ncbi:uncharacterized protein LOC126372644 [Pectinophora gossypiella]|uniref:uncharacterized protein LOC126372644 n=1 Tax=Pectinophora gossypiella TaxID=13191 RepID=UPI00214EBB6F|nr:uncharacterized protein LOC126372644 [Pectinophora gossypiella]
MKWRPNLENQPAFEIFSILPPIAPLPLLPITPIPPLIGSKLLGEDSSSEEDTTSTPGSAPAVGASVGVVSSVSSSTNTAGGKPVTITRGFMVQNVNGKVKETSWDDSPGKKNDDDTRMGDNGFGSIYS